MTRSKAAAAQGYKTIKDLKSHWKGSGDYVAPRTPPEMNSASSASTLGSARLDVVAATATSLTATTSLPRSTSTSPPSAGVPKAPRLYPYLGIFETNFQGLTVQTESKMVISMFPQRSSTPSPASKPSLDSPASDPKRQRRDRSLVAFTSSLDSIKSAPPKIDASTVKVPSSRNTIITNLAANGATLASPNEERLEDRYSAAVERLGTLVDGNARCLHSAPDWETFIQQEHGLPHL